MHSFLFWAFFDKKVYGFEITASYASGNIRQFYSEVRHFYITMISQRLSISGYEQEQKHIREDHKQKFWFTFFHKPMGFRANISRL